MPTVVRSFVSVVDPKTDPVRRGVVSLVCDLSAAGFEVHGHFLEQHLDISYPQTGYVLQ